VSTDSRFPSPLDSNWTAAFRIVRFEPEAADNWYDRVRNRQEYRPMRLRLFKSAIVILLVPSALLLAFSAVPFFARAVPLAVPQGATHKPLKAKPAAPAKELPMPFRVGETLDYRVSWASFATAATAELSIPERRDLYGWQTWHFRASAHTVSPVRALFAIDDQFDSYTDAATLESRQYETYLKEMGRRQDQHWRFAPEGQAPRIPGAAVIVPPGTGDPLGTLYSLRSVDWQRHAEIRAPVYDGHKLYEILAKLEVPAEPVEALAGKFSAARIGIQVFQRKAELSGITFAVWIADDPARTPVLMRAELPFGSLRVELTSSVH
jgi:Protein of unknown function (DUF3108)